MFMMKTSVELTIENLCNVVIYYAFIKIIGVDHRDTVKLIEIYVNVFDCESFYSLSS